MKKKLTRRKFLGTGLKGSVAVGSAAVAAFAPLGAADTPGVIPPAAEPPLPGLDRPEKELLRAAMDEIIPAGEGMPAASEVGGVDYLDRLAGTDPSIKKNLAESLAAVRDLSRKLLNEDFPSLLNAQRVKVLAELEKQSPGVFAVLRDYTYEAYYTQPQVWKLIGYEFHPTNQSGPHMKPFDEAVLAEVRKKPTFYRDAP